MTRHASFTSHAQFRPAPNTFSAAIHCFLPPPGGVISQLSEVDMDKVVERTAGYSGSDMKNLIQEACQGSIREAIATHREGISLLTERDLRPIILRDFQVRAAACNAHCRVHASTNLTLCVGSQLRYGCGFERIILAPMSARWEASIWCPMNLHVRDKCMHVVQMLERANTLMS